MALILSKLNLQMALYSVRVDPYFEGLIYPEKQTGSHKSCLSVLKWRGNVGVPLHLNKTNLHFSPKTD